MNLRNKKFQIDFFFQFFLHFLKIISHEEEQEEEEMDPKKEVIKVVDILGRETTIQPNMLLIYIYSDGSASAVIQVD